MIFIAIGAFDLGYLRRSFAAGFWPAPWPPDDEGQTPRREPRQHRRDKRHLSPTAPVRNDKSLTKVFVAAFDAPFRQPKLLDAKLVSVSSRKPFDIFPA